MSRLFGIFVCCTLMIAASVAGQTVAPSHPGEGSGRHFEARTTTTNTTGADVVWNTKGGSYKSIQDAVYAAMPGDTLELRVPAHSEGPIVIDRSLTLQGADLDGDPDTVDTVVMMAQDTGNSGDGRAWFLVETGIDLHVRDLGFDGSGVRVHQAFRHKGSGTFVNCRFREIRYNPSGPDYAGTAIVAFGGQVDVSDSVFEGMGRSGVLIFGTLASYSEVVNNRYTGKGVGDWLDYGFEVGGGATHVELTGNLAQNCRGIVLADGSNSSGVVVSTLFDPGADTSAFVKGNTLVDNAIGLAVGLGPDFSVVEASFNRIVGNTVGVTSTSTTVGAENNWWGCNDGPGNFGCDTSDGSGLPDFDPWLVLGLSATPDVLAFEETSLLRADLTHNSDGVDQSAVCTLPNGIPAQFTDGALGDVSPNARDLVSGFAEATYTAGTTPGFDTVSTIVDGQSVDVVIEIVGGAPPILVIPEAIPSALGLPVKVPVELNKNGNDITAVAFSVDYDENCLQYNSVTPLVPATFQTVVLFDDTDTDGEVDILVFDFPPDLQLPDGPLVEINFDTLCGPPPSLLPVPFSTDPTPTFGDRQGQDVPGNWDDGSILLLDGLRGDCNGDGMLGAADLAACGLELYDDDGTFWIDVPGSTFVGDPIGCDANADTIVDSGDVSCKGLLIFGLSCASEAAVPSAGRPKLDLPANLVPDAEGRVVVPVRFDAGGHSINSTVFSLDYDETRLSFDPDDPGAVVFHGEASVQSLSFDVGDGDGELDLIVADLSASPKPLDEGLLVEIVLQPIGDVEPLRDAVRFSLDPSASFGDVTGRSIEGEAEVILFGDGFESGDTSRWSSTEALD